MNFRDRLFLTKNFKDAPVVDSDGAKKLLLAEVRKSVAEGVPDRVIFVKAVFKDSKTPFICSFIPNPVELDTIRERVAAGMQLEDALEGCHWSHRDEPFSLPKYKEWADKGVPLEEASEEVYFKFYEFCKRGAWRSFLKK